MACNRRRPKSLRSGARGGLVREGAQRCKVFISAHDVGPGGWQPWLSPGGRAGPCGSSSVATAGMPRSLASGSLGRPKGRCSPGSIRPCPGSLPHRAWGRGPADGGTLPAAGPGASRVGESGAAASARACQQRGGRLAFLARRVVLDGDRERRSLMVGETCTLGISFAIFHPCGVFNLMQVPRQPQLQ
jgi:hypothetical protein